MGICVSSINPQLIFLPTHCNQDSILGVSSLLSKTEPINSPQSLVSNELFVRANKTVIIESGFPETSETPLKSPLRVHL